MMIQGPVICLRVANGAHTHTAQAFCSTCRGHTVPMCHAAIVPNLIHAILPFSPGGISSQIPLFPRSHFSVHGPV